MKLSSFWIVGTRDNGSKFWTLNNEAPQWLKNAVRDAHDGDLPDDWVYDECRAACDSIDSDAIEGHADDRLEVYTKPLYQWLADHCGTRLLALAEDEYEDCGMKHDILADRVSALQFFVIRYISDVIFNAYKDANQ